MWFNIFRVKTKIQIQLEEYVRFKATTSPFIAEDQNLLLKDFIKEIGNLSLDEITAENIEDYHTKIKNSLSGYKVILTMQAIRSFIRFHKHDTNLLADKITNTGIDDLGDVGKIIPVVPTVRPKIGRPMNLALVKKVKRLRDNEKLSFRAISKALNKDVKNIHIMYNYDISWSNVGKKVIHRTK